MAWEVILRLVAGGARRPGVNRDTICPALSYRMSACRPVSSYQLKSLVREHAIHGRLRHL